jgi:hypothetical protein
MRTSHFKIPFSGILLLFSLSFFTACTLNSVQEAVNEEKVSTKNQRKEQLNTQEKVWFSDIQDVGSVILSIAEKQPEALTEAILASQSPFYQDKMVFINDLLQPDAELYSYAPFVENFPEYLGSFRTVFNTYAEKHGVSSFDDNLTFYFPYIENHDFFSAQNELTVVIAQADTDAATGYRFREGKGEEVWVDDDYAAENLTLVVGVNALRERAMTYKELEEQQARAEEAGRPRNGRMQSDIMKTYCGKGRLKKHLDAFVSFTGNGGGSELYIARVNGYLKSSNQQITNVEGDKTRISFSRRDINKKKKRRLRVLWDSNWEEDDLEQIYAVWEDDTKGSKTFSGNLTTTITGGNAQNPTTPVTGTLNYSVTVETQDNIVEELSYSRNSLRLTHLSTVAGCLSDDEYAPSGMYWESIDCGADWSYTLSFRDF